LLVTTERIWGIIPAAGAGTRLGTTRAKQYLEIAGQSLLERSILGLVKAIDFENLIICVPPQDETANQLLKENAVLSIQFEAGNIRLVEGGETRAHSVSNGLAALSAQASDEDWVLVHDAARPLVSARDLQTLMDSISAHEVGGILATPAKDTLKQASGSSIEQTLIEQTLDRSMIWNAQTPQVFRFGLLRAAMQDALQASAQITDESSAVERQGFKPLLVASQDINIKITTPEDLLIAEAILKSPTPI
ncbi:MAG: 2-C-methyl-D-erythritol 4-phosphate cytidylyltransferase, partial [Pseudomonadota bacterium]